MTTTCAGSLPTRASSRRWSTGEEVISPSVQLRILAGGSDGLRLHPGPAAGRRQRAGLRRLPIPGRRGVRAADRDRRGEGAAPAGRRRGGGPVRHRLRRRPPGGGWSAYAVEINLREGGTSHPFGTLYLLAGGGCDPTGALYATARGEARCYVATDDLEHPERPRRRRRTVPGRRRGRRTALGPRAADRCGLAHAGRARTAGSGRGDRDRGRPGGRPRTVRPLRRPAARSRHAPRRGPDVPSDEAVLTAEAVAPLAPDGAAHSTPTTPGWRQLRALRYGGRPVCTGRPGRSWSPAPGWRPNGWPCRLIGSALAKTLAAVHGAPELLDELGLSPAERDLVSIEPGFNNADVNDRYDAFFSKRLGFVEVQGASPGGMGFHDAAARAFTETQVVRHRGRAVRARTALGAAVPARGHAERLPGLGRVGESRDRHRRLGRRAVDAGVRDHPGRSARRRDRSHDRRPAGADASTADGCARRDGRSTWSTAG